MVPIMLIVFALFQQNGLCFPHPFSRLDHHLDIVWFKDNSLYITKDLVTRSKSLATKKGDSPAKFSEFVWFDLQPHPEAVEAAEESEQVHKKREMARDEDNMFSNILTFIKKILSL